MAQTNAFFRSLIQLSYLILPLLAGCADGGEDASTPGPEQADQPISAPERRIPGFHGQPESVFGWQDILPELPSPTPRPESVFGWQDIPPELPSPTPRPESVFGWQDIPPELPSPTPKPESVFGWQDIPPELSSPTPEPESVFDWPGRSAAHVTTTPLP